MPSNRAPSAIQWSSYFLHPREVDAWQQRGWLPVEALEWIGCYLHEPPLGGYNTAEIHVEVATAFRAAGFDAQQASELWIQLGFAPQQAVAWTRHGYGYEDIHRIGNAAYLHGRQADRDAFAASRAPAARIVLALGAGVAASEVAWDAWDAGTAEALSALAALRFDPDLVPQRMATVRMPPTPPSWMHSAPIREPRLRRSHHRSRAPADPGALLGGLLGSWLCRSGQPAGRRQRLSCQLRMLRLVR